MSLDVWLTKVMPTQVFEMNITHNLGPMAKEAGIYECLWRPDEIGITKAGQLIKPLSFGLDLLLSDPERFEKFNAPNGWGTYIQFVPWIEEYLRACKEHPDADFSLDEILTNQYVESYY